MYRTHLFAVFLCVAGPGLVAAEDWPEFRGPTGQGHAPGPLPTEWGPDRNVAWKQAIPGSGWSSPVIHRGRVYLTTSVAGKDGGVSLRALALDAASGRILWDNEVIRKDAAALPRSHSKNSQASPTPIVDGQRLYVHFGHLGTAALDLDGKVLWRNLDLAYTPIHGNGGSPILAGDALVFSADGGDRQFVAALERATGKVLWRVDRKTDAFKKFSFSTPLLIEASGRKQIISPGSDVVCAYDPATGAELWRVRYEGYSLIPRPVFGHGLLFICTGYDSPGLLAIRPDGKGDVTGTHVAWSHKESVSLTPSLLLVGDELYMISDRGVASCLDARTGKVHWEERIGGAYSASPLLADGKIYFQSEEGVGTVIKASKKFEQLARNPMRERTLASYGVSDGSLFLRTEGQLYRIGKVRP